MTVITSRKNGQSLRYDTLEYIILVRGIRLLKLDIK